MIEAIRVLIHENRLKKIKKQGERYKKEKAVKDAYAEYWPEGKKRKVSNIMLVVSVIAIVGYVIANYVLQYKTGIELSPTITPYWFLFWTSEVFLLAGIKTSKVIKGHDE
jgi:hypothetical protein